ncbi:MAG TPA: hypothetical protein VK326_10095 [Solirubrobacterales bacterium]|nr:hypothetical protein [Solirubrobacterales bacterium]
MSPADEKRREAERYRAAAEEALDQLDWLVGYLERIHKSEIARALARNRSQIRRQLRQG